MRVRVTPVTNPGQAWIDTLDYHVRPALERAGQSVESWTQDGESLVSPGLDEVVATSLVDTLAEITLVRVVTEA